MSLVVVEASFVHNKLIHWIPSVLPLETRKNCRRFNGFPHRYEQILIFAVLNVLFGVSNTCFKLKIYIFTPVTTATSISSSSWLMWYCYCVARLLETVSTRIDNFYNCRAWQLENLSDSWLVNVYSTWMHGCVCYIRQTTTCSLLFKFRSTLWIFNCQ